MERKIIKTADGSVTIQLTNWDEQYHSKHGAIQEAKHVFIKNGLDKFKGRDIAVLEIGFGTGLNCFITFLENLNSCNTINYVGVEAYPVEQKEWEQLNYVDELNASKYKNIFTQLHTSEWGKTVEISPQFLLLKRKQYFSDIADINAFDLIYFDAFGARVQPELWTADIFKKMYQALKIGGILVTYSAKGSVRRAMQSVGFLVEKLPGPPGKREMLRATKI